MRRGQLGAIALGLTLLQPLPASAGRPPPSWAEYEGDRAVKLAWRALFEERTDDAGAQAQRAVELLPDSAEAWQIETRAAMGLGDWGRAEAGVHALRRLDAASPVGLELLGRIAVERGDADGAEAAFDALDGLQPDSPTPQLGLALVDARLRREPFEALAHLQRARAREATLDLSGLLLRPEWSSLATDAAFVQALTTLLRPLPSPEPVSPAAE